MRRRGEPCTQPPPLARSRRASKCGVLDKGSQGRLPRRVRVAYTLASRALHGVPSRHSGDRTACSIPCLIHWCAVPLALCPLLMTRGGDRPGFVVVVLLGELHFLSSAARNALWLFSVSATRRRPRRASADVPEVAEKVLYRAPQCAILPRLLTNKTTLRHACGYTRAIRATEKV